MKKATTKRLSIILTVMFALFTFIGCSPKSKKAEASSIDQTREMIFAASRDQAPGEKDAHYCTINLGVWEPLVTKDEDGNPAPALAESWESNDARTEWTFKLKKDVKFSNGTPFNSDIVVKNFDRYKKGPFPSSFYGMNIETTYPGLKDVVAIDENTVKLTFSKANPMLTYTMANFGSSIFEPSCFAEDGNFKEMAIGTGPYKLVENVVGEYCVIEKNENYHGDAPTLQKLKFRVISDANTRYSALLSGEVHGLCDLGAITPSLAAELEKNKDFTVSVGDSGITHFLNVNGNKFPFNDIKMREGLSLLLDREEIINEFYNGYGLPAGAFLNYTSPFYKKIDAVHNAEKGKKLIKEVIGDKEVNLEFILPTGDCNRYPYEEEAVYIQSLLSEVGINSNITVFEWGKCKEMMKSGSYDMCLKIQGLPSADPFGLFKGYMHSKGGSNIGYGLGYKNDHVDELIKNASNELNMDKRKSIYDELQDISSKDFPNIPVMYSQEVVACSSKVKGYKATPYGLTGYTQVEWAE